MHTFPLKSKKWPPQEYIPKYQSHKNASPLFHEQEVKQGLFQTSSALHFWQGDFVLILRYFSELITMSEKQSPVGMGAGV